MSPRAHNHSLAQTSLNSLRVALVGDRLVPHVEQRSGLCRPCFAAQTRTSHAECAQRAVDEEPPVRQLPPEIACVIQLSSSDAIGD